MNMHSMPRLRRAIATLVAVAGSFSYAGVAAAAVTNYPQDTTLHMTTINKDLVIVAGSKSDSLAVAASTFTVTVGAGDIFTVKYPSPAGEMPNDGGFAVCQMVASDNVINVTGPTTITFTPSLTLCATNTGGGGGSGNPEQPITITSPNGGESYSAGQNALITWTTPSTLIATVTIALSTDGGSSFGTTLASQVANNGNFTWSVPNMPTSLARIRITGYGTTGQQNSQDMSDANFSITAASTPGGGGGGGGGTTTPPPSNGNPPTGGQSSDASGIFNPQLATSESDSINADKRLTSFTPGAHCVAGSLIKGSQAAVYYCGADGKRYVFPNQRTYQSWYIDFSNVIHLTDAELAAIPIGGNVTYRPGVKMIKTQSSPTVYAVARGGILRPIQSEEVARALYGVNWAKHVEDISDAFFVNYTIGSPVTLADIPPGYVPPAEFVQAPVSCKSSTVFVSNLSVGSSGSEVLALQNVLKCLGMLSATPNGNYGSATEAAVKSFQNAHGIEAAGSVGASTRNALNALE